MTLGKGLGSGIPIGAVLARNKVARVFGPGSHGSTLGGNPLACSVGVEIIKVIDRRNLLESVTVLGEELKNRIEALRAKYSVIKEVRGRGFLLGVELNREHQGLP